MMNPDEIVEALRGRGLVGTVTEIDDVLIVRLEDTAEESLMARIPAGMEISAEALADAMLVAWKTKYPEGKDDNKEGDGAT